MRNSFCNYNLFLVISLTVVFKSVKCYSFERYDPMIDTEQIEEPNPSTSPIPIDIKRLPVNPDILSPFSRRRKDYYNKKKGDSFSFERLKQGIEIDPIEKYKTSTPIPIEIRRQPVNDVFLRPCSHGKSDNYDNQKYRRFRRKISSNVRKNRESLKFASNARRNGRPRISRHYV